MKILYAISRYFVGGLFIFSGLIKINDPVGTQIKLEEYFEVFTANGYRTYYFNGMTKNFIQCDSIEQSIHAVEHYHNLHDGDFLFVHKDKKGPFDVSY